MKQAISNAMKSGAKGVKIRCAGRLGGAEMARTEWYSDGRIPLHTLRANIDYANVTSQTTYGIIGVKVWVFKGLVFEARDKQYVENQPSRKPNYKKRKNKAE